MYRMLKFREARDLVMDPHAPEWCPPGARYLGMRLDRSVPDKDEHGHVTPLALRMKPTGPFEVRDEPSIRRAAKFGSLVPADAITAALCGVSLSEPEPAVAEESK